MFIWVKVIEKLGFVVLMVSDLIELIWMLLKWMVDFMERLFVELGMWIIRFDIGFCCLYWDI